MVIDWGAGQCKAESPTNVHSLSGIFAERRSSFIALVSNAQRSAGVKEVNGFIVGGAETSSWLGVIDGTPAAPLIYTIGLKSLKSLAKGPVMRS